MKKLFTLVMAACAIFGASAANWIASGNIQQTPHMVKAEAAADDDSESTMVFGYCGDLYDGLGTGSAGVALQGAIEIPATRAASWVGAEIVAVRIGYGQASSRAISLYITDNLSGTPTQKQSASITKLNGWNEISLNTPYTITGEKFYVGYSMTTRSATDFPIGIDGIPTNNTYGDYICANGEWEHVGPDFGSICIRIVLSGDNLPKYDASLDDIFINSAYVKPNTDFTINANVINNACKTITSLEATAKIGSKTYQNVQVTVPAGGIAPGEGATVSITGLQCAEQGSTIPVEVTITKVNGEDDENPLDNTGEMYVMCVENGFQRNVVVEEWTGTWCGWCVRGIVGMTYMREKYADKGFIGIAVHGGDQMEVSSYAPFLNKYAAGFPGCIIDRNFDFDPNQADLERYFLQEAQVPAIAKLSLSVPEYTAKPDAFAATANVEFAMDLDQANCSLAFVVIENNVGPYAQTNYYAGGTYGKMDGWENKSSKVSTNFNEVARGIYNCNGIEGSVPAKVEAGKTYTYQMDVPLTNVKNYADCEVIALLINNITGRIENAAVAVESAGVGSVNADAPLTIKAVAGGVAILGDYTAATVYGIDGAAVKIANGDSTIDLAPGAYIVKAIGPNGATATAKVLVR